MEKDKKMHLFYILYFLFFFAEAISFSLLISYLTTLGYSPSERSLFFFLNALLGMAGQVFFGYLCDRYHKIRPYLLMVIGGYALVTFLLYRFPVKNYLFQLITVMFLGGLMKIGNGLLDSLTLESGERYMAGFGIIRAFGSIGWAVGARIAAWLVSLSGYGALGRGFVLSAGVIAGILYLISDVQKTSKVKARLSDVSGLLANKRYVYITVMLLLLCFASFSRSFVVVDKIHMLKGTENDVGTYEAIAALVELPLFFGGYALMKKIGIKKLTALSAIALIGENLGFALAKTPGQIMLALALHVFTFPVIILVAKYLIDNETPDHLKTSGQQVALSIYNGGSNLLIPILTGLAEDAIGINPTIFIMAGMSVIPLLMCLNYRPASKA